MTNEWVVVGDVDLFLLQTTTLVMLGGWVRAKFKSDTLAVGTEPFHSHRKHERSVIPFHIPKWRPGNLL